MRSSYVIGAVGTLGWLMALSVAPVVNTQTNAKHNDPDAEATLQIVQGTVEEPLLYVNVNAAAVIDGARTNPLGGITPNAVQTIVFTKDVVFDQNVVFLGNVRVEGATVYEGGVEYGCAQETESK